MNLADVSLVREQQFRRLFCAQLVSTFGDAIAPIAIAFAALEHFGSAYPLGILLAARALTIAGFVMLGGVWADRLARRTVVVWSNVTSFVFQAAFAGALVLGIDSLGLLVALQVLSAVGVAFFRPASSGLVQESVAAPDLHQANALLSFSTNASAIAGPALAAALIAWISAPWAVMVDALTFGLAAVLYAGMALPERQAVDRRPIVHEVMEGLSAAREQPWILLSIVSFAVIQFTVLAPYSVLGPLVSQQDYGGATLWAMVTAAGGAGALLGDLFCLKYRPTRPLVAANLVLLGTLPLLVALAVRPHPLLVVVSGLLFGFCMGVPTIYWFTSLQQCVPAHLMSRVSAFDWMGSTALRPLGLAIVVPVSLLTGTMWLLLSCVVVTAALLVVYASLPVIRSLHANQPSVAVESADDMRGSAGA